MENPSEKTRYGSFGYKTQHPLNQENNLYHQNVQRPRWQTTYRQVDNKTTIKNQIKNKDSSFLVWFINSFFRFSGNRYSALKKHMREDYSDSSKNIINVIFWGIFLFFSYIVFCRPCCIVVKASALHMMFFLLLGKIIWNNLTKDDE